MGEGGEIFLFKQCGCHDNKLIKSSRARNAVVGLVTMATN